MKRLGLAAVAVGALALTAAPAAAHQSVLSAGGVVTWTHGDHANDPAIGVAACVQNRFGLVKCMTHLNYQFHFTAPYPQVAPNPEHAGRTRLFQETLGWWWETGRMGADGTAGACVFDNRPYRPPVLGQPRFFEVACLGGNDRTFKNPNDGSVDGTTTYTTPPADFIRGALA